NTNIVVQEIYKMLMNQISSLKKLDFFQFQNVTFTLYPGAKDCLINLSELCCYSRNSSEFFYNLSQICHNIQSLTIEFISRIISKVYKNFNYHFIMKKFLKVLKNYNILFSHNYKF